MSFLERDPTKVFLHACHTQQQCSKDVYVCHLLLYRWSMWTTEAMRLSRQNSCMSCHHVWLTSPTRQVYQGYYSALLSLIHLWTLWLCCFYTSHNLLLSVPLSRHLPPSSPPHPSPKLFWPSTFLSGIDSFHWCIFMCQKNNLSFAF